jgi:hypothetical protein
MSGIQALAASWNAIRSVSLTRIGGLVRLRLKVYPRTIRREGDSPILLSDHSSDGACSQNRDSPRWFSDRLLKSLGWVARYVPNGCGSPETYRRIVGADRTALMRVLAPASKGPLFLRAHLGFTGRPSRSDYRQPGPWRVVTACTRRGHAFRRWVKSKRRQVPSQILRKTIVWPCRGPTQGKLSQTTAGLGRARCT